MGTGSADEALKEIVELTRLYDVYGSLMSEHKKEIFESYVLDNLSLAEIAEQVGISRQGVRDIVKRCTKELQEYEEKLHFLEKMDKISGSVNESISIVNSVRKSIKLQKLNSDIDVGQHCKEYNPRLNNVLDELLSRLKDIEAIM